MHRRTVESGSKKWGDRSFVYLPFQEDEKQMQRCLDIELRKKFQGMEFRDFYELEAKVIEYEELLKEENYQRKKSMGTYFQEVNQKVAVAYLFVTRPFTCPPLVEKTPNV